MVKNTFFLSLLFIGMMGSFPGTARELELDIRESLSFISKFNDFTEKPKPPPEKWWMNQSNELKIAGLALIRTYQKWISPQDTPSCNFSVTCSRFAWESIRTYGVIGILMTADRLLRCHPLSRIYYPYDLISARSVDYPLSWYAPSSSEKK